MEYPNTPPRKVRLAFSRLSHLYLPLYQSPSLYISSVPHARRFSCLLLLSLSFCFVFTSRYDKSARRSSLAKSIKPVRRYDDQLARPIFASSRSKGSSAPRQRNSQFRSTYGTPLFQLIIHLRVRTRKTSGFSPSDRASRTSRPRV